MKTLKVYCVILGFNGVDLTALVCRKNRRVPEWQLANGHLGPRENAEDAADRIIFEHTGLKGVYVEQLHTFSRVDSATGNLQISISFLAMVNCTDLQSRFDGHGETMWVPLYQSRGLSNEEQEMIRMATIALREKPNVYPIVTNLLQRRFTITQLKKLYEAIFNVQLDKRNFYKKMMSLGILKRQPEKEKLSSRRGAFYYVMAERNQSYTNNLPEMHSGLVRSGGFASTQFGKTL